MRVLPQHASSDATLAEDHVLAVVVRGARRHQEELAARVRATECVRASRESVCERDRECARQRVCVRESVCVIDRLDGVWGAVIRKRVIVRKNWLCES